MEIISQSEYQAFFRPENFVLEKDGYGVKVLETRDEKVIKFFRLKRYFSSALLSPYALRFVKNAQKLKMLNIATIEVERVGYCPDAKRFVVIYRKINGCELRQLMKDHFEAEYLVRVAGFIAGLHQKGVYFRSLHFGNILVTGQNAFALIDLADMKVFNNPLGVGLRVRNFKHLFKYDEDHCVIDRFGIVSFISEYLQKSKMAEKSVLKFHRDWQSRGLPSISECPPSPNILDRIRRTYSKRP